MTSDPIERLDRQKLEYACFAVCSFLQSQLPQRLNAMEFLSITGQLPVPPAAMQHYTNPSELNQ